MESSDKAAARLVSLMQDPKVPFNVQLAAARDLLDRANVVGTQQISVETTKFDDVRRRIIVRWDEFDDDATDDDANILDAEVVDDEPAAITAGEYDYDYDEPDEPVRNRFDRSLDAEVQRGRAVRGGKSSPQMPPAADKPAPDHEFTPAFFDASAGPTQSNAAWKAGAMKRARGDDPTGLRPKRIRKR